MTTTMNPHHLQAGLDAGGARYALDGRSVHAGTALELLMPGGYWLPVRFESGPGGTPILYAPLGGGWENWRPPAGLREGDEVKVPCSYCGGSGLDRSGHPAGCVMCGGGGRRGEMILQPAAPLAQIMLSADALEWAVFRWPRAR